MSVVPSPRPGISVVASPRSAVGVVAALLAVAVALLVVAPSAPAWAHNSLKSATPAADATLTSAPAEVVLEFMQALNAQYTTVTVTGPDQQEIGGAPRVEGATTTVALDGTRFNGVYTVAYRVVSSDGSGCRVRTASRWPCRERRRHRRYRRRAAGRDEPGGGADRGEDRRQRCDDRRPRDRPAAAGIGGGLLLGPQPTHPLTGPQKPYRRVAGRRTLGG